MLKQSQHVRPRVLQGADGKRLRVGWLLWCQFQCFRAKMQNKYVQAVLVHIFSSCSWSAREHVDVISVCVILLFPVSLGKLAFF